MPAIVFQNITSESTINGQGQVAALRNHGGDTGSAWNLVSQRLANVPNVYLVMASMAILSLVVMGVAKVRSSMVSVASRRGVSGVANDASTWTNDIVDTDFMRSGEMEAPSRDQREIDRMVKEAGKRALADAANVRRMRKASKRDRHVSKKRRRSKAYKPLDKLRKQAKDAEIKALCSGSMNADSLVARDGPGVSGRHSRGSVNGADMGRVVMQGIDEEVEESDSESEYSVLDK